MAEWGTPVYRTWYSGFTPAGLPNTKNSLEQFNRSIKEYVTAHQRLSFSKLITKLKFKKELFYHSVMSKKADFPDEATIAKKEWDKAQLWAKEFKALFLKARNNNFFFAPAAILVQELKEQESFTKKI